MLPENGLIKKLYFNEGFAKEKIADILEVDEKRIDEVLQGCSQYSILTSVRKYKIRKISDKEYARLSKKALSIEPMYMFSLEMEKYLKRHNCKGLPEIYFVMSYFFGESSSMYDSHKSSFRYLFKLKVFEQEGQKVKGEYLVSVGDVKQGIEVRFYKLAEGKPKEDYSKYHSPFSDLKEKEMKKIWFWFMAFVKNAVNYFKEEGIAFKPFCRKIEYGRVIYGCKNGEFFSENYLEGENRQEFQAQYKKYNQEIKGLIKEGEYQNRATEIISKIIDQTNSESVPDYEFKNLDFEIYRVAYACFDLDDVEEAREKADQFTKLIRHYFVFKSEIDSDAEYFKENKQLEELTFSDFKASLEEVKNNWSAKEYTTEEIDEVFNYYKKHYLQGIKFSIIEMLLDNTEDKLEPTTSKKVLNQALENLNKIESRQELLEISLILGSGSWSTKEEIISLLGKTDLIKG